MLSQIMFESYYTLFWNILRVLVCYELEDWHFVLEVFHRFFLDWEWEVPYLDFLARCIHCQVLKLLLSMLLPSPFGPEAQL